MKTDVMVTNVYLCENLVNFMYESALTILCVAYSLSEQWQEDKEAWKSDIKISQCGTNFLVRNFTS